MIPMLTKFRNWVYLAILFVLAILIGFCVAQLSPSLVSPLPTPASPISPISPVVVQQAAFPVSSEAAASLDAILDASDRLKLCCQTQKVLVSGVGITFLCRYQQHDMQANVMDFQDCIIHVDDAERFFEVFEIYFPVVVK